MTESERQANGKANFCTHCGFATKHAANFCPNCGKSILMKAKIEADAKQKIEDAPRSIEDLRDHSSSAENSVPKTDDGPDLLRVTVVSTLVLILVFGVISAVSNQGDNIDSNSTSLANEFSILDEPAAKYFNTGEALTTLTQVWGIALSDESGARTLRDVTDEVFDYLQASVGGSSPLTQQDIEVAFQPGNSMYSFFTRLVFDQEAYDAIFERLMANAS